MSAVSYRLLRPTERGFVVSTWLESFRYADAAGVVPMDMYASVYAASIERLLARPAADVVVAAVDVGGGEDEAAGWLCAERHPRGPVVHYAYIAKGQRGEGLLRGMFAFAGIDPGDAFTFTFRTGGTSAAVRKHCRYARYDPLCARFDSAYKEDR